MEQVALGMKTKRALSITGVSRHQYYYKPKGGRRGPKASSSTMYRGQELSNEEVLKAIRANQADPDLHYGYAKMTVELQMQGYQIGKKKVYRLMKQHQLLQARKKPQQDKTYVKYRRVCPSQPYELMEMDIKMVWIESSRSHAYILTVLDTFSRKVLNWTAAMSITQHSVKDIWNAIVIEHLQANDSLKKGIEIQVRNDNDKRFSAKMVQSFFEENHLNQVFTHPYTPQENGHIESFHAILGRSLDRVHFHTIDDLQTHLTLFYEKYNNQRLHSSLAKLPPNVFLHYWENDQIIRCLDDQNRKVKFKLRIPYHLIRQSGNGNGREASCYNYLTLDGSNNCPDKKANGATAIQPSVQRSPSVASC